jgi:peroxiredoxin (alkyl hydroperoxide reductase subunit C)
MKKMLWLAVLVLAVTAAPASAVSDGRVLAEAGERKPIDSELRVKAGDAAPDFTLESVSGKTVSLSDYRGRSNVMISFIPAAWTPVCSDQWPGYAITEDLFKSRDTVILGISTDNVPTLHAWTSQMEGLWFPVLSDFWPHGEAAGRYGVLRSDGTADRAVVIVDKKGVIRFVRVYAIDRHPPLEEIVRELERLD